MSSLPLHRLRGPGATVGRVDTPPYSMYLFSNMSMNLSTTRPPEGESTQSYPVPPIWGGQVGIVENIGVEPMTSCVQGRRSSQLS